MPAILKGYIDRVFSYGFAYEERDGELVGLLSDKRVILEKLFVYILFKGSPSKHNYGPCAFLDFFNYLSLQP